MRTDLFNSQLSDAKFSECRKHRLWLYRIWDNSKPLLMVIGLNPSTANAEIDDPTIRKVKSIAAYNGYGGVYMMNLFTFISTDPKRLSIKEGNYKDSDLALRCVYFFCQDIVFAWGNFNVLGRDEQVKRMFPYALALHINQNGSPKHPLYCKNETHLVKYQ